VPLTSAQLTALSTDIDANTATAPGTQGQIKDLEHTADNAFAVAVWYNQYPAADFYVWDKAVSTEVIFDKVTFANYTPTDAADATVTYTNRAMLLQTKQMNLQLLLQGRSTFNATKLNQRAGLNDATTSLPSGTAGASRSGGWSAILPILSRKANNVEKLFAVDDGAGIGNVTTDPRGANTNPDLAVFEGTISDTDVRAVWGI
jgi:hypothetical protein